MTHIHDLIEAHRAAEIASNDAHAAADLVDPNSVEGQEAEAPACARREELKKSLVDLLLSRPKNEEEARAKAAYVRSSEDCIDGGLVDDVWMSIVDGLCTSPVAPTLAELIEAHRAAEAAVEAAADDDVAARYAALVDARVELLAYAPRSEDEAREKAGYVRASADMTEDEMGAEAVVSLVDRLCEFQPA